MALLPRRGTRLMTAPQPEDIGIAAKIMAGLGAALAALGTWAWAWTHRRIESVDKKADSKASAEEVDRHRDHIAKLFDKISELSDKTEIKFTVLERQSTDRHIELLNAIHSIN